MRKKSQLILATCLLFSTVTFSQDTKISNEIRFIQHLMNNNEYENAIILLNNINTQYKLADSSHDIVNYLKAICFFNQKKFDSSSYFFKKVGNASNNYIKSLFLSAISDAYLYKTQSAIQTLFKINTSDSNLIKLKNLQLAGMYLLERKLDSCLYISSEFDQSNFATSKQEKNIQKYFEILSEKKKKSMFLAILMSALIPGSGKIYAGRTGDGVSSLLATLSLGLVAFENFKKDGILNYKTLFFTGLFSTFYAGNIWGTIYSVKMEKEDSNHEIDNNILLDLHYSLFTVFN